MRVLFVSDAQMQPVAPAVAAGSRTRPTLALAGDPRRLLTGPPHFPRRAPDAHADTDLVEALEAAGVTVERADWSELAGGSVDLTGVDLVHLRPGLLRRGPSSGDRRDSAGPPDGGSGRFGAFRRHPSVAAVDRPVDRRSAAGVLGHVPPDVAIVLTLPARPAGPVAGARGAEPPRPVQVSPGPPGSRGVHVIAADPGAANGLQAVLPHTHAATVAVIGRGFGEPARARAFDVDAAVVLVITTPGSASEAGTVLRALEMLGRAGLRFAVVLAGVGPMVRGVQRRVALAEAAGVDVRLLGRASRDELARWRCTASVCVVTSCEPGADADLADLLLSGIPVVAALDPVHADVAAQTRVPPGWFVPGDAADLARQIHERLVTAAPAVRPSAGAAEPEPEPEPVRGPEPARDASVADPGRSQEEGTAGDGPRVAVLAPPGPPPGTRALPSWADIAGQTFWVYQKAVRAPRG